MGLTVANYILQPFFSVDCGVPPLAAQLFAAAMICKVVIYNFYIYRLLTNRLSSNSGNRFFDIHKLLRRQIDDQNAKRFHVHKNCSFTVGYHGRCSVDVFG